MIDAFLSNSNASCIWRNLYCGVFLCTDGCLFEFFENKSSSAKVLMVQNTSEQHFPILYISCYTVCGSSELDVWWFIQFCNLLFFEICMSLDVELCWSPNIDEYVHQLLHHMLHYIQAYVIYLCEIVHSEIHVQTTFFSMEFRKINESLVH